MFIVQQKPVVDWLSDMEQDYYKEQGVRTRIDKERTLSALIFAYWDEVWLLWTKCTKMIDSSGRSVPFVQQTQVVDWLSDIEQDYYKEQGVRTRIDKERTLSVLIFAYSNEVWLLWTKCTRKGNA